MATFTNEQERELRLQARRRFQRRSFGFRVTFKDGCFRLCDTLQEAVRIADGHTSAVVEEYNMGWCVYPATS